MITREIFRAKGVPVFQNKMFATEAAALACPKGDVVLVQDNDTGLISNVSFNAALLKYDADYQNEQACSGIFQNHLTSVTEIIHRHFHGKTLIEVGCGKGYFLEHLRQSGYEIIGIDPAYEGVSPYIVKSRFKSGLGLSAEGVVLRHVLEHIPDPVAFLSIIAEANGGKGDIYIEVPCFDWICHHRAWFDVFYEHVNYFRLSDLRRMFGAVHDGGHIFGGQYLYAVADLSTLHKPLAKKQDIVNFPRNFTKCLQRFLSVSTTGKRKAIWGAGAKGMMFAWHMKRVGMTTDLVIDINPAKQGKFMAGSGLRVTSLEEALRTLQPGDDIFVMNSNYLDEIIAQSSDSFHYLTVDTYEFCQ